MTSIRYMKLNKVTNGPPWVLSYNLWKKVVKVLSSS